MKAGQDIKTILYYYIILIGGCLEEEEELLIPKTKGGGGKFVSSVGPPCTHPDDAFLSKKEFHWLGFPTVLSFAFVDASRQEMFANLAVHTLCQSNQMDGGESTCKVRILSALGSQDG